MVRGAKKGLIGLIGEGLIFQDVQRLTADIYEIVSCSVESTPQQLAACDIIVYCSDIWSPRMLQEINHRCLQARVALLPVYTQFDQGIIGPCVLPQKKGCTHCAELRLLEAALSQAERELLQRYIYQDQEAQDNQGKISQPWLSSFSAGTLAALAIEEVSTYLRRPEHIQTACALLTVSLETLECSRHPFLALASCAECGEMAEDSAEQAVVVLQSRLKVDVHTYRLKQPVASAEQILATYVDPQIGLVPSLTIDNQHLLPLASSQLASATETVHGTGCTVRPEQSKLVAVLEAIERYAGLYPRRKYTVVQASYRQLIQQEKAVLDPTTLGLHTQEQYEQHKEHTCDQIVPYHHDLTCNWVWGYSFQQRSPLLVPEHCAYYGVPVSEENPHFVFDASNGCALGNCLEEAIFHGILEVVERDAFLLMWYAQLGVPRLDLRSVEDATIRVLVEHIEYRSGYTIHAFDITLDHTIPCICVLGVDEQDREGMPKVYVAAGSHLHPEQALLKALREFAMFLAVPRHLDQEQRAEALKLLADASLVQTIDDHPLVYFLPEAFERLDFLYHTPRAHTFQQAFPDFYQYPSERLDLRDDLECLIDFYGKRGTDIIAIDQTAPEHQQCGLHCVKILMPGLLPMTFGQENRRVTGLERLYQVPFTLGYQDHPLIDAEVNPHPHPFS
ncbi:SagD family biosynthesis docking scaffold protein [Reticulibacter mediterranei]|uniref:SagD family biosynthesis docking scaffold protein n=1 Tax=Reticulibacter mediterranei TaxID=2778369 RepID=A0A8J3IPE2_9CHLR|nr:TOMM precursor leader peptide-binding protein [Reticulibacter mediterranei]GHO93021.1 SagD family biosynthesis docking scaffold protein [Reticulibacter mediterranei]